MFDATLFMHFEHQRVDVLIHELLVAEARKMFAQIECMLQTMHFFAGVAAIDQIKGTAVHRVHLVLLHEVTL